MSNDFERQKNLQASVYTAIITGGLLLLFILVKWAIPTPVPPPAEEAIEVNLGNSDQGSGNDQPLLPGDPAPKEQVAYVPPQPVHATEENVKDVSSDETSKDAAEVIKPKVSKPDATKINDENKTVKTKVTPAPKPVVEAPPRPKAVLGHVLGGNGNGGNGADSYKPGSNQGIAGGNGDQGRPGGDPNGKSYTGTPKNFGVREFSIPNQSFQDDFNQNAKVAMEIETDGNGKVISANHTYKGSTGTATSSMLEIARRRAFELKVGPNMKGTVIFNFQVKG